MEKYFLKFFFVLAAPLTFTALAACSKVEDSGTGLNSYTVVSGTFTQQDAIALDGTGTIRFFGTLAGAIDSNKAIEIAGSLSPSGSIAVVFNSGDQNIPSSQGVIVKITRDGLSPSVSGSIAVNGTAVAIQPTRLAYVLPAAFDLIIQVYNTSTLTRVLIWKKDSVTYSLDNVEVDSSTLSHINGTYPTGGGSGVFIGMQLVAARITVAQVIDAKVALP